MLKMTAHTMTAAKLAFGTLDRYGVRKPRAMSTSTPVNRPPSGVCTPDALLTTVREKEPVTGIELKKDPIKFDSPILMSSWLASTRSCPAIQLVISISYNLPVNVCSETKILHPNAHS